MKETGFCLGSNLGDRLAWLRSARDRLVATSGATLLAQSPVYETDPVGVKPEFRDLKYLNAVIILASSLDARSWLLRAQAIEVELGRIRGEDRFAPRTMDIDLLYHGADHLDDGGLIIPHPRWMTRLFVLRPLADVRPHLRLPGSERTVIEQMAVLADSSEKVRLYAPFW